MAQIRIPSFLKKLDKEEKYERMKEYMVWRNQHCTEYMKKHLESELTKLVEEEEKSSFPTWFQTRWNKAKSLGRRQVLRQIIKDLT